MSTQFIKVTAKAFSYQSEKVTRGKRLPNKYGTDLLYDHAYERKSRMVRCEAVKLTARNVEETFHSVSLLLQEKVGSRVLNSRKVDFGYIPPGSEAEQEVEQFTEPKGVWSITGMFVDGHLHAYNQSLPRIGHGENCFVATVVYQDAKNPNVDEFRALRDAFLERSEMGQKLIDWYYRNGPRIASVIERFPILRQAAKAILTPVAHALKAMRKHKQ
jgi:hypothetical protein